MFTDFTGSFFVDLSKGASPTPYHIWSFDDPNYGMSADQYALYDIDLDAWYDAHELTGG